MIPLVKGPGENTVTVTSIDTERPLRADARRNRARIIEAARELFAGEQPNVQMDDIARAAGVGRTTVFRRFDSKDRLVQTVMLRVVGQATKRVQAVFERVTRDLAGASLRAVPSEEHGLHPRRSAELQYKGQTLGRLTVSAGIAVFPEHGSTCAELLKIADECLYESKARGRDIVTLALPQNA